MPLHKDKDKDRDRDHKVKGRGRAWLLFAACRSCKAKDRDKAREGRLLRGGGSWSDRG